MYKYVYFRLGNLVLKVVFVSFERGVLYNTQ